MASSTWVETTRFRPDDLCRFTLRSDRNPIEGRVHEFVSYDGELGLSIQTGVATYAEIPFDEIERIEVQE